MAALGENGGVRPLVVFAALFILLSIVPTLRRFGLAFALFTAVNLFSAFDGLGR